MAALRVLVPLVLFVVITLAEHPSPDRTTFLDNQIIQYDETEANPEESKKSKDFKTIIDIKDSNYAKVEPSTKINYRLSNNVVPEHYNIDLQINLTELSEKDTKYTGNVMILLNVTSDTNRIQLHFDKSLLTLKHKNIFDSNNKSVKCEEINVPELNNTSIMTFDTALKSSNKYTFQLEYEGIVSDKNYGFYKGSYLNSEGKTRWYVATHFEPIGARSAFPCFDEPDKKATFKISIKYNQGYNAISNMNGNTEEVDKNQQLTIFEKTPIMSTYLVAFAITDFKSVKKNKVTVYSRPEAIDMAEFAAEVGQEVLTKLEKYIGIDYSSTIGKIDQIALPLLSPGAMENWGLVTYRETTILYDESVNATIDKLRVPDIIAHEFTHQWFGNLVTPQWWKYIWLNEGFATYFQYLIVDQLNPDWRYMDQFNVLSLQSRAFVYDANGKKTRPMDSDEKSENEIKDLFDNIAYDKAAAVIRMFSHVLGENKFKQGLQNYLTKYTNKTVVSDNLFQSLEEVVDKKTLPEKVTLTDILKNWATLPGYPLITVTKNRKGRKASITVEQEPFYTVEPEKKNNQGWYIPLNYVQQKENVNFDDTSVMLWLKSNKKSIDIEEGIEKQGWVIFNVQQTGYYRVNYDKETWNDIADNLRVNNSIIHPLNRAQLIDDAFNLAYADILDIGVTLNLIKYLDQETDYIVWKAAFNGLSKLNNLLRRTKLYNEFLKFVNPITKSLLDNVQLVENKNETDLTKLLRVDAIKWACDIAYDPFKAYATKQFNLWLNEDNNVTTISRDLKKVILCGALKKANVTLWTSMMNKYIVSTDPEEKAVILSSLGCSSSPEILKNFFNIAVQKDSNFNQHLPEIFRSVYSNSAIGVEVVLNFINTNLNKLQLYDNNFNENVLKYLTDLANRIAIEEDVGLINNIAVQLVINNKTMEDEIIEIRDIAKRNYEWYKKHNENIQTWLNETDVIPKTTTTKPEKKNSANSLSFNIGLIVVSLLLVRLR